MKDFELTKMVISYVLNFLDVNDMDSIVELITRLQVAKDVCDKMQPWDADDVLPIIFADYADEPVITEEVPADAE